MEVLRRSFVEINDFVSWRSRIGKTTCWKHKVDFSFWNSWAKIFSVIPFSHAFLVLTTQEKENYGVILVQIWILIINIYFLVGFSCFSHVFSFLKSWIISHIVNPIKSYIRFAPFWVSVWWLLQKWFLIPNKLKRSIPGSAGQLNDSMLEDFLIMCCISSFSFNQKTAFGRGDRLSTK